ncbi:MAG: hypothetical protein Q6373_007160 [Candidatus Sigynarchaeota archaeon]
MGRSKKPSRKDDIAKAHAYIDRYREHQVNVNREPTSLALAHWKREKEHFKTRAAYYLGRAGVDIDDITRK